MRLNDWFLIGLEFRAAGYTICDLVTIMALHFVYIPPDDMAQVVAAYRCQIGREQ